MRDRTCSGEPCQKPSCEASLSTYFPRVLNLLLPVYDRSLRKQKSFWGTVKVFSQRVCSDFSSLHPEFQDSRIPQAALVLDFYQGCFWIAVRWTSITAIVLRRRTDVPNTVWTLAPAEWSAFVVDLLECLPLSGSWLCPSVAVRLAWQIPLPYFSTWHCEFGWVKKQRLTPIGSLS